MEPTTTEVIVTEKRYIPPQIKLVIVVIVLLALGLSGYVLYQNNVGKNTQSILLESYGLTEPVLETDIPSGALLYRASIVDEAAVTAGPFVFRRSVSGDTSGTVFPQTISSYVSFDDGSALIVESGESNSILQYTESTGAIESLPVAVTDLVEDLAISTDQTEIAVVTVDKNNNPTVTIYNRANWSIITTIPGAKNPVSVVDTESAWWYQTVDGVFRLPAGSESALLVSDVYAPFTQGEEYSVSPDGRTLIVTVLGENLVSVQDVRSNGAVEIGRLVTPNTTYTSPVISDDGHWYAVVATTENSTALEFRLVGQSVPVLVQELTEIQPHSVAILGWEDEIEIWTDYQSE